MNITDFIAQAHPATLDWLEDSLMEKLIEFDRAQKLLCAAQELRKETNALV